LFNIIEHDYLLQTAIFGALGLAAIYHTILYFHIKIKLLLYYSAYLLFVFLYSVFRLIYPSTEIIRNILPQIQLDDLLSLFTFLMYIRFLSLSLALHPDSEKFTMGFIKLTYWLIGIYIFVQLLTINVFGWHKNNFYIKTSLRSYMLLVGMYFIIALFRKREEPFYKYLSLGAMFFILLGLISTIANIIRPAVFITTPLNWLFLAYLADVICFSAAMGIYVRNQTLEKQAAELESLRINNTLKKTELEKKDAIIEERNRIITDLHDDVGATLSSLNIYGDLACNVWDTQPEESKKMMKKISIISKDLMNRMADIVWSMKSADEEKYTLEARLKNYCTELLSPKNIVVEFDIYDKLTATITDPEIRKNILLIAKEAINNIAKYSMATKAKISFKQQKEMGLLMISDNGKGFEINAIKPGNGIGNIQNRCSQLKGSCHIDTALDDGVAITCSFPIAIISHTDR
jgi:signal transduction histidine kinase